MVCNRLKVFGGAESYMFSVGDELRRLNHDVQYFGLFFGDERHGNSYGIYAKKGKTPWSIVQNRQNRLRFAKLLDLYKRVCLPLLYRAEDCDCLNANEVFRYGCNSD